MSKKNRMGVSERLFGVHSKNEYLIGDEYSLFNMISYAQIFSYNNIITKLNTSLEEIIKFVFTRAFQKLYSFAENASFSIPTATSYLDKVILLAPQFESILKQFKLFVEDGSIDFELLQISSVPLSLKDIPSINDKKYIYLDKNNKIIDRCLKLFFQTNPFFLMSKPIKKRIIILFLI